MKKLSLLVTLLAFIVTFPLIAQDADFYFNRGMEYGYSGDFDSAIADLSEAIRLKPDYVDAYLYRGSAYGIKEQWDQCIKDWNEALRLVPDFPDIKKGLAQAYGHRGIIYYDRGELDLSIADFTRAIALDPDYVDAWNNRGNVYEDKGELDRAIEDYTTAIGLDPNWAYPWNGRGNAYEDKGELDRAIEDYTRAIALDPNWAYPWNNRGNAYNDKGEFDSAIEDYSRAIALDANLAQAWNGRGNAYKNKGELDRAIEDYSRAITLDNNLAGAWNNRGLAYQAKGEFDRAIEDYIKAIALDENFILAWNNRGGAYTEKGELDLAIADFTRAIALDENDTYTWYNRGNAYFKKGDLDLAIADFRQSIEAADKSGNMLDVFHRAWEFTGFYYKNDPFLGGIHEHTNRVRLADLVREVLVRSISRAEKARSTLGARGAQIMTGLLYQYYAGVDFEAVVGSAETAFSYSEALRSRGFLEQMGTEAALKLQGVSEEDAQNVRRLIRDIDNLRDLLSRLNPQTDGGKYAEAGLALSRAEAELAALDAAITRKAPRYAELRNPQTATLAQTISFCGDNTAILEYVIWDSDEDSKKEFRAPSRSSYPDWPTINSYCLVITKNGITAVKLEPGFDYAKMINELRRKITTLRRDGAPIFTEAEFEPERNALYNVLIKPVLEYLPKNITELMIVPDSTLGHLPFDLLRENSGSPDLGQSYRLSLSPSVSVSILAAETKVAQSVPIMAFGGAWYSSDKTAVDRSQRGLAFDIDPDEGEGQTSNKDPVWRDLPGTETEVKNLQTLAASPNNIRVLLGNQVSEEQIKALSSQGDLVKYPILHFACHGYFNENDPGRSGIVLSEVSGLLDNGEDGYLTIPEIVLLNLKARMILLSACETGLGVVRRGDGMVGMARAFLVSGAENVGVSLWSISDEATMAIMTALYSKVLKEGKTFKEAYYQVRNEFRRDKRWSHPFYWAAFTMYE